MQAIDGDNTPTAPALRMEQKALPKVL